MSRRRLFAALILTGQLADEVNGLRRSLGSEELGRIPPHITLAAPVNVPEAELGAAAALLSAAAAGAAPITVTLGPPATFWPVAPVCYLSVSGEVPALSRLRDELTAAGGPLAPPPGRPERPFVPHVTVNQRIDPGEIDGALAALSHYRADVTFERVALLAYVEGDRRWVPFSDARLAPRSISGRGGLEVEVSESDHLDPVAALWAQAAWRQYSLERYGPEAGIDEPFALVARIAGEIAGTADGQLRRHVARLARLIVAPQWRGHGVGSALLRQTERVAAGHGSERVRLETVGGGEAEGFYRRKGYEVVAGLPRWREELDFVVMERLVS